MRHSIDEILAAVIAEHPRRIEAVDIAYYVARVDGWWSFDQIADAIGGDATTVLRALNRVSIAIRREDLRNTRLLLERVRQRLNGANYDQRIKVQPGPAEGRGRGRDL